MNSKYFGVFALTLKLFVVALVIFIVANGNQFTNQVGNISRNTILAAMTIQVFVLISILLGGIRLALLMGVDCRAHLFFAVRAIILAQGLNATLPARLSEVLKVTYMRDHANVSLSRGFSGLILERTVDLLIVITLGLILAAFFHYDNLVYIAVVGLIFVLFIFIAIQFPGVLSQILRIIPSARLAKFVLRAYKHFIITVKAPMFWQALIISALIWGLSYLSFFVFLKWGGSISVGFAGALAVFFATTLSGVIPGLPGGFGTYEAAAVFTLHSLGYDYKEALTLSIVMHVSQLALPFLFAILIMILERIGLSSLVAELRKSISIKDSLNS